MALRFSADFAYEGESLDEAIAEFRSEIDGTVVIEVDDRKLAGMWPYVSVTAGDVATILSAVYVYCGKDADTFADLVLQPHTIEVI